MATYPSVTTRGSCTVALSLPHGAPWSRRTRHLFSASVRLPVLRARRYRPATDHHFPCLLLPLPSSFFLRCFYCRCLWLQRPWTWQLKTRFMLALLLPQGAEGIASSLTSRRLCMGWMAAFWTAAAPRQVTRCEKERRGSAQQPLYRSRRGGRAWRRRRGESEKNEKKKERERWMGSGRERQRQSKEGEGSLRGGEEVNNSNECEWE